MHITELEISKQLKSAPIYGLKSIFRKHGWEYLGSGAEASVALHPNRSYVLKVFRSSSKYQLFVKFCAQHVNNPHLPTFSRYVRPIPGTAFSYVRMEKLNKVSEQQLASTYMPEMRALYDVGQAHHIDTIGDSLNDHLIAQWGFWDTYTADQLYNKLNKQPPASWLEIIEQLCKYAVDQGMRHMDLHDENFMLRQQTLVILDPFY
jgi:hypothetical protein